MNPLFYRSQHSTIWPILFYLGLSISATTAAGQGVFPQQGAFDFTEFISHLEQVNQYSPTEGAGSRGTFGTKVGLGLKMTQRNRQDESLLTVPLGEEDPRKDPTTLSPQLLLERGLSIPLNFGVSYSRVNNSTAQQWAGHLQWTFFQLPRWPAVAARYSLAKLSGLPQAQIISQSAEVISSYGFRFVTLFYSYRYRLHHTKLNYNNGGEGVYRRANSSQGGGIQVTILPPFTSIAVEAQKASDGQTTYFGRMSYLL